MPPRPSPPSAATAGQQPPRAGGARPTAARPTLRARLAVRLGLAGLGILGGLGLLGILWSKPDPGLEAQQERSIADLAKPPNRPVTVLVIGVDADRLTDPTNKAAPPGPANADALLLLRVNPGGPLQVLGVPTSLAVKLPGQTQLLPLGSLYRRGGPALTADAVRDLVGLEPGKPDRYLVVSRGALRSLVDGLGSVEVNPSATMRYSDKRQGLTIDLQGGLQRLKGQQLEHLARYRDPARPVESRLANQQEVVRSLLKELSLTSQVDALPELVEKLREEVDTNLSPAEVLSLMAASVGADPPTQFSTLPLAPPRSGGKDKGGPQQLREMARSAPDPLWPEPAPPEPAGERAQAP
ncbi:MULTISPECIES: LCP family protein [Aphanothece]|uniref:LCP family protein n=1 Tax=Aphanothece TaxID=1121 RepID=UPI00398525EC